MLVANKFENYILKKAWYPTQQKELDTFMKEQRKKISIESILNVLFRNKKRELRKDGYYIRNKRFIQRVKTFLGCQSGFCRWQGKIPYSGLHFHHRDPKTKLRNISDMDGYSLPKIKAEMRKCDVLCGVCHAIAEDERSLKNAS